jgi:hypothetical protein
MISTSRQEPLTQQANAVGGNLVTCADVTSGRQVAQTLPICKKRKAEYGKLN